MIKMINKFFKTYLPFSKNQIQTSLAYRINFFTYTIGSIIWAIVPFYIWKAVYASSNSNIIKGYSFYDIVLYSFTSYIAAGITYSEIDFTIGEEINNGSISLNLIKPISYKIRLLFDSLGILFLRLFTIYLPILIVVILYLYKYNYYIKLEFIFLFLISTFLGFLIYFLFNYSFGLLAFFTMNIWGLRFTKSAIINLISGRLIPLEYFPESINRILDLLPFKHIIYTPCIIIQGRLSNYNLIKFFLLQIMWIIILIIISNLIWKLAVKKITINGG